MVICIFALCMDTGLFGYCYLFFKIIEQVKIYELMLMVNDSNYLLRKDVKPLSYMYWLC